MTFTQGLCCIASLGTGTCCIVFGPCGVSLCINSQISQFGLTAGWPASRKTVDLGARPHHFPNWSCREFSGTAIGPLCWDAVTVRWRFDKYDTFLAEADETFHDDKMSLSVNNWAERRSATSSRDFHVYPTCLISQGCLHTESSAW